MLLLVNYLKQISFLTDNKSLNSHQVVEYYQNLINKYPIISIEDGLDEMIGEDGNP